MTSDKDKQLESGGQKSCGTTTPTPRCGAVLKIDGERHACCTKLLGHRGVHMEGKTAWSVDLAARHDK